jgi:hypothetical protein
MRHASYQWRGGTRYSTESRARTDVRSGAGPGRGRADVRLTRRAFARPPLPSATEQGEAIGMPYDPGHDDDDIQTGDEGRTRRFGDFDCPDCNANNPHDDGFGDGDEVRCYYCGQEFRALVSDQGRLRLKAV